MRTSSSPPATLDPAPSRRPEPLRGGRAGLGDLGENGLVELRWHQSVRRAYGGSQAQVRVSPPPRAPHARRARDPAPRHQRYDPRAALLRRTARMRDRERGFLRGSAPTPGHERTLPRRSAPWRCRGGPVPCVPTPRAPRGADGTRVSARARRIPDGGIGESRRSNRACAAPPARRLSPYRSGSSPRPDPCAGRRPPGCHGARHG